jgi:pantetheine-phosphate adenylyltransferase
MPRTAFYPGTFDPVTNGHLDVVARASRLVDRVVVGVGVHPGKAPALSAEARIALLRETCEPIAAAAGAALDVVTFDGLVVEAALASGASVLIRGLRDAADFDYEMQMAGTNAQLAPDLQTVFIPASPSVRFIAATFVRQIAAMGGDVGNLVPPAAVRALKARFAT